MLHSEFLKVYQRKLEKLSRNCKHSNLKIKIPLSTKLLASIIHIISVQFSIMISCIFLTSNIQLNYY